MSARDTDAYHLIAEGMEQLAARITRQPEGVKLTRVHQLDRATLVGIAIDRGAVMAEHRAAFPITIQVLEGRIKVSIEDDEVDLVEGGLLEIEPNRTHSLRGVRESLVLLTIYRGSS